MQLWTMDIYLKVVEPLNLLSILSISMSHNTCKSLEVRAHCARTALGGFFVRVLREGDLSEGDVLILSERFSSSARVRARGGRGRRRTDWYDSQGIKE